MSAVIDSFRGDVCPICRDDFKGEDRRVTHVGGEGHDGFHFECLKSSLLFNPDSGCPFDKTPVNISTLASRTERIKTESLHSLNRAAPICMCVGLVVVISGALTVAGGITATLASESEKVQDLSVAILIGGFVVAGIGAVAIVAGGLNLNYD